MVWNLGLESLNGRPAYVRAGVCQCQSTQDISAFTIEFVVTVQTLCMLLRATKWYSFCEINRKWWTEVKASDNSSCALWIGWWSRRAHQLRKQIKDLCRAAISHTLSAAILFFIHVSLPSQLLEWQVRLSSLWTLSSYWRSRLNWSTVISFCLAESVGKWERGAALLWMNKELFPGEGVEPDLKYIIEQQWEL